MKNLKASVAVAARLAHRAVARRTRQLGCGAQRALNVAWRLALNHHRRRIRGDNRCVAAAAIAAVFCCASVHGRAASGQQTGGKKKGKAGKAHEKLLMKHEVGGKCNHPHARFRARARTMRHKSAAASAYSFILYMLAVVKSIFQCNTLKQSSNTVCRARHAALHT